MLSARACSPVLQASHPWALTIYDRATFAFIYSDSGKTTLSSYDLDKMKKNTDGSVTLYVGPKPPEGLAFELASHRREATDAYHSLLRRNRRTFRENIQNA